MTMVDTSEARFVCTNCHSCGRGRMHSIPGRSVGLFVLLFPIACILTAESRLLGDALVLLVPLWIAVLAMPVVWFLLPSRLRCTVCYVTALIPVTTPRGAEIIQSKSQSRAEQG